MHDDHLHHEGKLGRELPVQGGVGRFGGLRIKKSGGISKEEKRVRTGDSKKENLGATLRCAQPNNPDRPVSHIENGGSGHYRKGNTPGRGGKKTEVGRGASMLQETKENKKWGKGQADRINRRRGKTRIGDDK